MLYSVIFNFVPKNILEDDLIITISNISAENESNACTIAINEFVKSHFPPSYYEAYKKIEKLYIVDENNSYMKSEYKPSTNNKELEWHEFASEECLKYTVKESFSNEINEILKSLQHIREVEKESPQQSQFISLLVRRNVSIEKIIKTFLTRINLDIISGIYINIR